MQITNPANFGNRLNGNPISTPQPKIPPLPVLPPTTNYQQLGLPAPLEFKLDYTGTNWSSGLGFDAGGTGQTILSIFVPVALPKRYVYYSIAPLLTASDQAFIGQLTFYRNNTLLNSVPISFVINPSALPTNYKSATPNINGDWQQQTAKIQSDSGVTPKKYAMGNHAENILKVYGLPYIYDTMPPIELDINCDEIRMQQIYRNAIDYFDGFLACFSSKH